MSDKNEDTNVLESEIKKLNINDIETLVLENKEIDSTEKTIVNGNITLIRKDIDARKITRNTGTNNWDFNNGVPGVYLFRHSNYDTIYGTQAYKAGNYTLSTMQSQYGFYNDDCSSMLAFNDFVTGDAFDIYIYQHDNWTGTMTRLKSDGTYDNSTYPGYYMQYGYWVGNGWQRVYCGSPVLWMNDQVSSMIVKNIVVQGLPPNVTLTPQSNLTSTGGNSRFYTRINGVDYNVDSLVRTGAANTTKGRYGHNSGYFEGQPNNSSNIYDGTLINFNGGNSIDYVNNFLFAHDNNSGRANLANYFGAPYEDYGEGTYTSRTIPAWCNRVICICLGAGGGGAAGRFGDNDGQGGGGGGSGAAVCAYIDCNGGEQIIISAGPGGGAAGWEGGNGNSGGPSYVLVGSHQIIAYGGQGGFAGNPAGNGGTYYTTGASVIKYQNGVGGGWGAQADDDDDEMNSNWEGFRAAGGGSIYNWTATYNGKGAGGAGGHFGDDDKFDGDYGDGGSGGFVRVYYVRK
jgi:hypothetical protein